MAETPEEKLSDESSAQPVSPSVPFLVLRGPITDDPMDMTSVTLEAGTFYSIDDDGVIRDPDGCRMCQIQIYRTFPRDPRRSLPPDLEEESRGGTDEYAR